MHICTSNPKVIRTEVENMRDDFNNRLTQILFSSFFSAYYACFLPLVFVQVCYIITFKLYVLISCTAILYKFPVLWYDLSGQYYVINTVMFKQNS